MKVARQEDDVETSLYHLLRVRLSLDRGTCACRKHTVASVWLRSALGAERKRWWRNACRELPGRLSCEIEATDRSAAD